MNLNLVPNQKNNSKNQNKHKCITLQRRYRPIIYKLKINSIFKESAVL